MKDEVPFERDLPLQNLDKLILCLTSFSSVCVSLFWTLYTNFDATSCNIDEVLSINPSTNVFVLGDFKIYHNDRLTCSGGTDRPRKHYYIFSISNDLT